MLDIKSIRENPQNIQEALVTKNVNIDVDRILSLDQKRRDLIVQIDDLKEKQNKASQDIARLKKEGEDVQQTISAMKGISAQIDEMKPVLKSAEEELHTLLIMLPNVPHSSVPIGGADHNKAVRAWAGEIPEKSFKLKDHIELAKNLDIIDFDRSTKLSGTNFILFKNEGALLERALINFMLNLHTQEHGYIEIAPPFLVNTESMTGTGQLPKMKEDMYHLTEDDLYLIPTAEVPVTNIHRDEILKEEDLPIQYTAYTPCFRREAGSYGKDTRGLMRVHQFDKVELVKFVKPEESYQELEKLVINAEAVFQLLKIPYRVLELATGDLSFAAAKCYDIEIYAPGLDAWLEASSCSNFEDFQARRSGIRYKGADTPKATFVHTLNGSGVALPRTIIAILEHYQTKDGGIEIPEALHPYTNGLTHIKPR